VKIVIVGNYNEKKAGANFYATVRKLANGFTRNGHAVLPYSDRDVSRGTSPWGIGRAGVRKTNRQLVDVCRDFRPDLIVMLHADQIANDTLREIKGFLPALRIASVNIDALFVPENPPRIHRLADVADMSFLTTAGDLLSQFATPSHRVAFIPNPADRSIENLECFARADQAFDLLCAVGSVAGAPWRADAMRTLKASVPEGRYGFFGIDGQGPVYGAAYFDAIANSRMGLNLNRSDADYLYSSDRFAQLAGNGLLVFVERTSGYGDIFAEDEFAFYEGPQELADKLRYFLTHDEERQAVARKGHAKYHALFNERLVARFIAEATFGRHNPVDYAWPTTVYGG
jgi:hypothetical protein